MGNLSLLCVARSEDDATLYGFAYGYNNSTPDFPQLIILLKTTIPSTPPSSLSSLTWNLVSLVLSSKVTNLYSQLDLTNTACAASSTGIFTFISQQYEKMGGFRYDLTLGSGTPRPPSTKNFAESDPYWVNMTMNLGSNWTTSTLNNVFPKLFYVPATGVTGGHNLVLSSVKEGTVQFAQENQDRGIDYTGTLQTPLTYMRNVGANAYLNGQLYLIGAPMNTNHAVVLSMPISDGNVSSLPPVADLMFYNYTQADESQACFSEVIVTAAVTANSLYLVCMEFSGGTNMIFSIPDLSADTLVGPAVQIPATSDSTSLSYQQTMNSLFDFFLLAPLSASPPSASKGYGFLMGYNGPHLVPLDGSGPMALDQVDWITSVLDLDANQTNMVSPNTRSGSNSSSGLSGGAWAGIAIGVLVLLLFAYLAKRRRRPIPQIETQSQVDGVLRALQQQRQQLAGHVFPGLSGSTGGEQKGGAINAEIAASSPSSPPPLQPRPQQSPPTSGQLSGSHAPMSPQQPLHLENWGQGQFSQSTLPGLSFQPNSPTPFLSSFRTGNNNNSVLDGTSQEQFRQTLQLSTHPRPKVVMTTRTPDNGG